MQPQVEGFLTQRMNEVISYDESLMKLQQLTQRAFASR